MTVLLPSFTEEEDNEVGSEVRLPDLTLSLLFFLTVTIRLCSRDIKQHFEIWISLESLQGRLEDANCITGSSRVD